MSVYRQFYAALLNEVNDICPTVFGIGQNLSGTYANIFHIDATELEHVFANEAGSVYYQKIFVQIDVNSDYSKSAAYAVAQKIKIKLMQNLFTMTDYRIVNVIFNNMISTNNKDKEGFSYKMNLTYYIGN